uniref:NADH-ubiquinone oxidoreductase chain 3 n=1 Tax=Myrsidea sp. ADS-2020 TaxID=2794901 RepID=A0A7T1HF17_9NEOP|nr:NADH dehydrogenase subunit 3 [Myrsidea sp. ADS-2020]
MLNTGVFIFMIMISISILLFVISSMFMENESNELSETAFECGFEPFFMPRVPFSVHFFTVTIVFLIFDLEVVILVPILFKLSNFWTLINFTFMIWILLGGLFMEWFDSSVSWQL